MSMLYHRTIPLIMLLALVSAACGRNAPTAPPAPAAGLAAPTASPQQATDTPHLTPPVVTPLPVPTFPAEFAPRLYYPAMLPNFASDVDDLGHAPRYAIAVTLDLTEWELDGHERVRYTNTAADTLDAIYLRLFPAAPGYGAAMTVSNVTLNGQKVETRLEQRGTALRVPVTLAPQSSAELTLDFIVSIPRDPTVGYAMFGLSEGVLALPNFYPVIPVYDESGWHVELAPDYGDETYTPTALYDVSITVPVTQVIATSGTCQHIQAGAWRCVSGPMRDFMLAMSTNYQTATQTVDGVTLRSYYLPGDETGGQRAREVAADALQVFSRRFGPYPFAELDVVETPTRAGGIEYPGLVVIARSLYSQPGEGSYFDFVVAHEVAHQWWYSLVGNDQVNHPWMDEALVGYSTILYYEDVYGQAVADQVLRQTFEAPYRQLVQDKRDQKVDQPVAAFSQSDYSAVVYRKGPLFFKALRESIGEDKFNAFLKTYFRQNLYGIAMPERMLAAAEAVADRNTVRSLYAQWIQSATRP